MNSRYVIYDKENEQMIGAGPGIGGGECGLWSSEEGATNRATRYAEKWPGTYLVCQLVPKTKVSVKRTVQAEPV